MKKLQNNDIVILRNGDKLRVNRNYLLSINSGLPILHLGYFNKETLTHEDNKNYDIIKVLRPEYKIVFEHKELLDKEEKEYLSQVIRPFRDKIKFIVKENRYSNNCFIKAILENNDGLCLPDFKKGTMYKNLEIGKDYTLKDLNL